MQPDDPIAASGAGESTVSRRPLALVLAVALGLYALRMLGPCDLADHYHQERAAAYVLDILVHHHWICQSGIEGEVTSKPPMFTWLAALANLPWARPHWLALVLPAALSTIATALLIGHTGSRGFGRTAGTLAAMAFLLSPAGVKMMGLARIDGLFTFTVALAAWRAFVAWQTGRGWTAFWLAAAASALTKGPLGPLLALVGLLAVLSERRSAMPLPLRGNHTLGVALFVALTVGWLFLAYRQVGPPLIQTLLGDELWRHAVGGRDREIPLREFYKPTLYLVSRFLPWSLLTFAGLWRVWKTPATDAAERRFERFLAWGLAGGLFVFSLAAHQRADLVFPLLPAAALLAGRELERLVRRLGEHASRRLVLAVVGLGLLATGIKYAVLAPRDELVRRTRAVRELAVEIERAGARPGQLNHVDSPAALQFFLGTKRPLVSLEEAAKLARADEAAFIVIRDVERLRKELAGSGSEVHEIARVALDRGALVLVGNAAASRPGGRIGVYLGRLHVTMNASADVQFRAGAIQVDGAAAESGLAIANDGAEPQDVRVRFLEHGAGIELRRVLGRGDRWQPIQ